LGDILGSQSYSIWIAAPPERVFDLYTDLDRIGEWQEGHPQITDVSGDPSEAGSSYISRRGRLASRFEVVAADRPSRHVVAFDGPAGLRAELNAGFAAVNNGTQLTLHLDARWRSPLLGRILEMAVFNRRIANRELGKLKGLAEREYG
jgi:uncharacterized protein YndB with AHSA1/START domain